MSANRLVATLTPVAAVLAGVAANWLAKNAPGVDLPASALEEVFIAGIAAVVAPAAMWMLGWQKHEAREAATVERAESLDLALAAASAPEGAVDPSLLVQSATSAELDEADLGAATELDDFATEIDDFDDVDMGDDEDLDDEDDEGFPAGLAVPGSPQPVS